MYRINSILQAERLSVIEGYKELVKQDSSLMPLESSRFQEDDEIVGITINMIEKDMTWNNDHHQQAIRDLKILQQQLFNQRTERNKYNKKNANNKNNMEQEKQEDWKDMVNLERYHVMSEEEIVEKLNKENPSRNMCTSDHAMMAWEYLKEPINENESDHENCSSPDNEENSQKNSAEEEEADDEFSESSSSTDYDHLECERIQRQHYFAWQYEDKNTMHQTRRRFPEEIDCSRNFK